MKTSKRRTYSSDEKALLLEAYKSNGILRKQWCKENGIGLSTLQRWLQQEKRQMNSDPVQSWVPVVAKSNKNLNVGRQWFLAASKTSGRRSF